MSLCAPRTQADIHPGEPEHHLDHGLLDSFGLLLSRRFQLCADALQVLPLARIGQKAEMANLHESGRKDMEEEPSDELVGIEGEQFHLIVVGSVPVAEGDGTLLDRADTVIGDSHPMSVAAEILQYLLWPGISNNN